MKRVIVVVVVGFTTILSPTIGEETSGIEYVYAGEWHDCPEYAFSQPGRIAVAPTGEVFVTDENLRRLTEWTWCGSYRRAWKDFEDVDTFNGYNFIPADVAVGFEGYVFLISCNEVRRYDAEGNFVGAWLVAGGEWDVYDHAWSIATGPGGDVYALLSPPGCIRQYTPEGVFLGQWGSKGSGEGEFGRAFDVAVSPVTANVYVADEGKACIQYYTPAGSFLGRWGTAGSGRGEFGESLSIAVGPGGTVFVADAYNDRVQYFTSTGSYLGLVDCDSEGYRYTYFQWPTGIAVAPNGYVYVADRGLDRVFYFKPQIIEEK